MGESGKMFLSTKLISFEQFKSNKIAFKGIEDLRNDPLNQDKIDIRKVDTVGWVFSGGGAKGAFEIGVASALARAEMMPNVIIGTSVGALNAAALAKGDINNAGKIWQEISNDKVYTTKVTKIILKGLAQILDWLGAKNPVKIKSILDNSPLRKLVHKEIDPKVITGPNPPVEIMLGATALNNGKEGVYATPRLFENLKESYADSDINKLFKLTPENFEDAVIASSAFPVVFPALQIDDELFVDGGAGNNTPARNGVDALFAINSDLKEGLLFVVMLDPQKKVDEEILTDKNTDLAKVGIKTLNVILDNTAKMDVKMTQKITHEIERWDVINIQVQEAVNKIGQAAIGLKEKAQAITQIANLLPNKEKEAAKLRKIAEEISLLAAEDIENPNKELTQILSKYKPFNGKKKIKMVIIRPQESLGIDTFEFDKAGKKANEVIRLGYDSALKAMLQSELINKATFNELMQQQPLPADNIFEHPKRALSKVV